MIVEFRKFQQVFDITHNVTDINEETRLLNAVQSKH